MNCEIVRPNEIGRGNGVGHLPVPKPGAGPDVNTHTEDRTVEDAKWSAIVVLRILHILLLFRLPPLGRIVRRAVDPFLL